MTNTLETGGSERQFVTMANSLNREEFSVTAGCLRKFGPLVDEIEDLHVFSAGGSLFGMQSLRARLALARFLRQKRVHVAHSFDFYSNLMLILAAKMARAPVVIGSHRQLGDLLTPRQFKTQSAVFRLCDRIVCNSQAAANSLKNVARTKVAVIPNGLPDIFFAPAVPALPRMDDVVCIGMIARMNHPLKGHELFLRAAKKVSERYSELRFVLAGDGPLRPRLEKLANDLGIFQQTLFVGDRRDIPAILASLDISVLPSASESLSNVIMESMAVGLPVVAADIGGNPELVRNGQTGFLFPRGDETKVTAALETLITQPELRKQFGERARAIAKAEYKISTVRDRYQDLYRCLLVEKGRSTPVSLEWQTTSASRQGQ
jgi:L-malate glycosyltransferase